MFLPSQLPVGLRKGINEAIPPSSSAEAATEKPEEEMGGKAKKSGAARHRDEEMLAPSSPMAQQQPSTSAAAYRASAQWDGQQYQQPHGFMARGWARISGRRRRQKRRQLAEQRRDERVATQLTTVAADQSPPIGGGLGQTGQEQQQERQPSWPSAGEGGGGNLAGLAHLEEGRKRHFLGRSMDRLRRSIRRSLHKGSSSQSGQVLTQPSSAADGRHPSFSNGPSGGGVVTVSESSTKNYCNSDEIAVRSAACSFPVKYLGTCEVFESRGMSVCESALQHLRSRKRTIKALLYVSGDGIRVVDQENNRGLIVDQTIEKVSFCSPDRHNDKGFAYICRDGATRRWMCHGFQASKDTGERLSHAVGCAFTVCLEKKRKRDAETAAFKNAQTLASSLNSSGDDRHQQQRAEDTSHQQPKQQQRSPRELSTEFPEIGPQFARTNQGYRSFRPLSISERRADPQKAILVEQPRPQSMMADSAVATPRPTANPTLFERTGSLRAPAPASSSMMLNNPSSAAPPIPGPRAPLNRYNTLPSSVGVFDPRASLPRMSLHNEPIWEGEDDGGGTEEPLPVNAANHWANEAINSRENSHRFYRTLPHSMPNFGQQVHSNWPPPLLLSSSMFPPTIPEEDKQPPAQAAMAPEMMDNNSSNSPPADPFTSREEEQQPQPQQKLHAEDWLEQTFQRAASLRTMPRSATMNWPPLAPQQPQQPQQQPRPNWAQFTAPPPPQSSLLLPKSQSFQPQQQQRQRTNNWVPGQDWADGGASSSSCSLSMASLQMPAAASKCPPPAQPPPPLPSWLLTSSTGAAQGSFGEQQQPVPTAVPNVLLRSKGGNNGGSSARRPATDLDLQMQSPTSSANSAPAAIKNHSRKASGNRRIEYQLLQETDLSLSPPKSGFMMERNDRAVTETTASAAADPFDVCWSQRVLEEAAANKQQRGGQQQNGQGNGGGAEEKTPRTAANSSSKAPPLPPPPNPFGWDMAPSASVDV